jgi:ribonuclease VapC
MLIDTSALAAVVKKEFGYQRYKDAIIDARENPRLSSVSLLEASIVLHDRLPLLDEFLTEAGVVVAEFSLAMAQTAREAFLRYGKGRHRAGLNFGDCAAYATARELNLPLLFKGDDFIHTDIRDALA